MSKRFAAGEVLFRQGDPSDFVVLIRSGEVEVLRETSHEPVPLGTVGSGEHVGEMGVLECQPRSATVRALNDVEADLIGRGAFLVTVKEDPELAYRLVVRMSARLRIADELVARLDEAAGGSAVASPSREPEAPAEIRLVAANPSTQVFVGPDPVPVTHLPFVVGRRAGPHEAAGTARVHLEIRDPWPFRLSRAHFSLDRDDGRIVVRDLDSELGTVVNGTPLGRDFPTDSIALEPGENRLHLGGRFSPYAFNVILD
jgi:CRP-like cAMP-binding protein